VQCWGVNASGQLGDGTTVGRLTPVPVTSLSSGVQAIAVGGLHSCALTTAGATQCWGSNVFGQLGDDTTISRTTPVPVIGLGSGVQAVAAGDTHTCAVTMTGALRCWGSNILGELGDGTTIQRLTPVAVTGSGSGVQAVAAGRHNTCALSTGGVVLCWGRNDAGQLGDGTQTQRSTPVVVLGDWLQVFRDGFE
jgi:alpha-tubulin suppressor-like RCC1 family protein